METILTAIGLLGVAMVIIAYGVMTAGKWAANSPRYQWLNLIGTACVLPSIITSWNLPAFIGNVMWILIGVVSLVRIYRKKTSQFCHSYESGNPFFTSEGDSRVRGNDKESNKSEQ